MDLSSRSNISEEVRQYLGNFGERLMTTQEAKSIGSVIAKKDGDDDVLNNIYYHCFLQRLAVLLFQVPFTIAEYFLY